MTGRGADPTVGTLEELLEQIEQMPRGAPAFQLWVPEDLTYEGEPITLEAAMAVVVNELLAREMFPDGYEQGLGGRTYRYQHEPTGAPPHRASEPASVVARWMVRALRAVGIRPKRTRLQPGQIWRYRTRAGEEESRVQILKIDRHPDIGEIIHIAVIGVQIARSPGDQTPISIIGHVPIARDALEASDLSLETRNAEIPDFSEGYEMWRTGFEAGNAGVFSLPVAEIVGAMEATIRGGAA